MSKVKIGKSNDYYDDEQPSELPFLLRCIFFLSSVYLFIYHLQFICFTIHLH